MIKRYNTYKHFKPKRGFFRRIIIFLFFVFISFQSFSQANVYVLKAVYLEKISRFVTWPEESLMNDFDEPFVISVIGKTSLTNNLEQIYEIQKINNKHVIIKRISNLYEIENSHILVIAESEKKNLKNILSLTKNLPILTISETSSFGISGVLINFYEENNKLRFEINETAVLQSPLQISFYLLNSAKIINPIKNN
ncbi:MAG: YfiR family protein [Bacteroidales bacterium]|nr:YfiR family protein [Bacteroidales bacterium]